jgi:hypothetical protein
MKTITLTRTVQQSTQVGQRKNRVTGSALPSSPPGEVSPVHGTGFVLYSLSRPHRQSDANHRWRVSLVLHFLSTPDSQTGHRQVRVRSWLQQWNARLRKMSTLEDGWDSYSAPAPTPIAIRSAFRYLLLLSDLGTPPTRLAPSVIGGVGVTRRRGGKKVYVEFFNDGSVHALFADDRTEEMRTRSVTDTHQEFRSLIMETERYLHA